MLVDGYPPSQTDYERLCHTLLWNGIQAKRNAYAASLTPTTYTNCWVDTINAISGDSSTLVTSNMAYDATNKLYYQTGAGSITAGSLVTGSIINRVANINTLFFTINSGQFTSGMASTDNGATWTTGLLPNVMHNVSGLAANGSLLKMKLFVTTGSIDDFGALVW